MKKELSADEASFEIPDSEIPIDIFWKDFHKNRSSHSREKLILYYAPLVKYVAHRVGSGLPSFVQLEDLVSYGIFGLMDAIEKYNPARGIKFETYAIARIKGAIIDELRLDDWVPRSIRQKAKQVEKAYRELEEKLSRVPTDSEVASHLDVSHADYLKLIESLSPISIVALDELWTGSDEKPVGISVADKVEDYRAVEPEKNVELEEIKESLADAIDKLPKRERLIISLYYYEGLTMREIGEVLGVSESRVCQIHTRAVLRLSSRLKPFSS
ncbi:MAG: FliA/WhiG family RNA polymerase sigma factor [Actinomycetota bacterium]|nr:FliA/WhiG family RNA polymerase sigma factor [Actinomycetota bacterium]